jgi:undecaprenyl-diphosphatase
MRPTTLPGRPIRRVSRAAAPQIALACVAVAGVVLLARAVDFDEPPPVDLRVRALARSGAGPRVGRALLPLFPIGLPGGYITIAYATAHWLHRKRRRGGPALVTASWLGWLVHRGAKLIYLRQRPPGGPKGGRSDSYPSGHTTGITALATTAAFVLRRQRLISRAATALIGLGAPALMGTYRVLADEHWATDVAGGWMLGGAIGLACNAVLADAIGRGEHGATAREPKPRRPRLHSRRERPSYVA